MTHAPITRVTSTGKLLMLVEPDAPETPEPAAPCHLEIEAAVRDLGLDMTAGKVLGVCILAQTSEGTTFYNTVSDLADLTVMRDELGDMIADTRRGDDG